MRIRSSGGRTAATLVGVAVAAAAALAVGWLVFYRLPDTGAQFAGVVATLLLAAAATKVAATVIGRALAGYNVAEVAVEGPITRDGGQPSPLAAVGESADGIVEAIERADEDGKAEALLVKLNTPGGEVVPSDDIRRAAERFDGPTVAYATDTCASGGYWIASGCDELWAREASVVGSIGVLGSRPNVAGLAERLGISYEQFTAGEYKDAGTPLKELTDDERAYLQGIVDDFYEQFVKRVTEGRNLDAATVRDTEARVYLGEEARELGLVDELGARPAVEDRVEELVGEPVEVRTFEPSRGIAERIGVGTRGVAYALGAGVAAAVAGDDGDAPLRLR